MNELIQARLAALRARMARHRLDYYLMPTADYHSSEYVADFFKAREHFSGFTGSNGTLVVSNDSAGLWTDGRYFIQAEKELEGTGITLFRMADEGVPTINEYLKTHMKSGETLGFDGRVVSVKLGEGLEEDLLPLGIGIVCDFDVAGEAWTDRPELPENGIFVIDDELAGRSTAEKLDDVRKALDADGQDCLFLSSLDDICWLFNIRGNDVECSPVALSYAWITMDEAVLFLRDKGVTAETAAYLDAIGVVRKSYEEVPAFLDGLDILLKTVRYDRDRTSYGVMKKLEAAAERTGGFVCEGKDPTLMLKAVKNETELRNIREVYLRDSAALCRFLCWVKKNAGKVPMTEVSLAEKLDAMRAELPGFIELSFPTISAYGSNAAMMHYEATEEDHADIKAEGLYLVDSGGTYLGGTTDVTRTIVLGEVSQEVKRHFTAVAVGMLRLANARFLRGCTGRNLDILARGPVWDLDIDYKCGTGHGIGYMLNVHEGPHSIRWRYLAGDGEAEILPGMLVSDEPGVYIEGSHGIRTENILECTAGEKNDNGQFLGFEMLTWVPIDLDGIDPEFMEPREKKWLNDYHKEVRSRLAPLIDDSEVLEWLEEATREI